LDYGLKGKVEMNVNIGSELINPVTGERGVVRVAPSEENGRTLVADLFIQPGGAVSGEHVHPNLQEAFTVLRGRVGMRLNGQELIAPLNERIVVPVGVVHDWWNAGDDEAHVQVEVMPGDRFLEMIANLFGLAQDGKTNNKGMPNLLQLVLFGKEFEDVIVFTKPPRWVFGLMYTLLGTTARLLGYRGSYPKYLELLSSNKVKPAIKEPLARRSKA
jgi:quercetin dioxygenase-like cupin family protein